MGENFVERLREKERTQRLMMEAVDGLEAERKKGRILFFKVLFAGAVLVTFAYVFLEAFLPSFGSLIASVKSSIGSIAETQRPAQDLDTTSFSKFAKILQNGDGTGSAPPEKKAPDAAPGVMAPAIAALTATAPPSGMAPPSAPPPPAAPPVAASAPPPSPPPAPPVAAAPAPPVQPAAAPSPPPPAPIAATPPPAPVAPPRPAPPQKVEDLHVEAVPVQASPPQPIAVQPLAVQPIAVQPIAVQPVAVQPIAVQAIAVQPLPAAAAAPVAFPEPQRSDFLPASAAQEKLVAELEHWVAAHPAPLSAAQYQALSQPPPALLELERDGNLKP